MITWTNTTVKLSDLRPWKRNPRRINAKEADRLGQSFDEFGQVETIAIGPDNEVYNGHQRLTVLLKKHGPNYEIEARQSSRALTEKQREKLTVYLHRGAAGEWDIDALAGWDVNELVEWGFGADEVAGWGEPKETQQGNAEPQTNRAEELRELWGVELGQMWAIGEHRLICGDCTDAATVERVMGGERAVLMVTDPPYGVDYGELVRGRENQKQGWWDDIQNDALSDDDLFALLKASLHGAGALTGFVFHPAGERRWLFWNAVKENGWKVAQEIVWVKNALVFGRADYQWRHEPCLYIKKDGARKKQEDRTQTTVWEVNKPTNSIHPTQKPVGLFEIAVRNHTEIGDVAYEPFAGSGTTIVACQNLNRRCRAVEISPAYCAVILQRMADAFPGIDIHRMED